jgi:hypothetical protein
MHKVCAPGLGACVPAVISEFAVPAQVVFDKRAVDEAALGETAVCKGGSAEGAVAEPDTYKRSYVEQAPVPIRVFDHAANKNAVEAAAFDVEFSEIAVLERAFSPPSWERFSAFKFGGFVEDGHRECVADKQSARFNTKLLCMNFYQAVRDVNPQGVALQVAI